MGIEVAYEILIDGLKKYGAEIIGGGLFFVTLWLWRRYQKKIISGLKFMLLFVIAVIVATGLYALVSFLGGAFLLGFVSAGLIDTYKADRFRHVHYFCCLFVVSILCIFSSNNTN